VTIAPAPYDAVAPGYDLVAAGREMRVDFALPLNACELCCDRHAGDGRAAMTFVAPDGAVTRLDFEALRQLSARMANLLASLGVRPGDRVAGLLPRTPALAAVILGVLRAGGVYQPLFTAFGPKAIEHRIGASGAHVIFTDAANRAKLEGIDATIVVVDAGMAGLDALLSAHSPLFEPVRQGADRPFFIMFTSGTTGPSKPVLVPPSALANIFAYMRHAIDLRADDRFWNIADPGWAYGLYYGLIGPLLLGNGNLWCEEGFTAEGAVKAIAQFGITNLAGAPTAYRLLAAADPALFAVIAGQLRVVSSAGEPLNPEIVRWFGDILGAPVRDHYGQTEMGMCLCDHHGLEHPRVPGASGRALPGFALAVVDAGGRVVADGATGVLAIRRDSPLMYFTGYDGLGTNAFVGDYYLTGDVVRRSGDDLFFVGRDDDVITTSGYRVGPFDIESALLERPEVIEAGVVGIPDAERTEIIKAFIVLREGHAPSRALEDALRDHVRARVGRHAYPREISFVSELPKTPSGKIQRHLLRRPAKD